MRLSEAIRQGSALSSQAFGYFKKGDGSTCALGSAAEAAGFTFKGEQCVIGIELDEFLRAKFPALAGHKQVPFTCPDCHEGLISTYFSTIIAHVNDVHKWSREKIADWVEKEEDQLGIPRSVATETVKREELVTV